MRCLKIIIVILAMCAASVAQLRVVQSRSGAAAATGAVFGTASTAEDNLANQTIATGGSLTVAAGDLIVCQTSGASATTATVTCGGSNTLTFIAANNEPGGFNQRTFYKENAASYTGTCSADWGSAGINFQSITCANYSNVLTSSSLLNNSCNGASCNALAATSTSRTAQNVTPTSGSRLLIAFGVDWNGTVTESGANSFNLRVDAVTPFLFDKNVTANGSTAYPSGNFGTVGSTDQYLSQFLVFATN